MNRILTSLCASLIMVGYASGQELCTQCYDQNEQVNTGVNNLILNGSFEETTCIAWPMMWDVYCPASSQYSCDLDNWTCTGGGTSIYALLYDVSVAPIPEGTNAAYLGAAFCAICDQNAPGDTSCLVMTDCEAQLPENMPWHTEEYGGTEGVSISQTVPGLTIGAIYTLEFWAGGEAFQLPGVFAVDVGFGRKLLRCKPTPIGAIGSRYVITFAATSTEHTVKFTNWGHISSWASEVLVDDVRLFPSSLPGGVGVANFSVTQLNCGPSVYCTPDQVANIDYLWNMGDGTTYTAASLSHTYASPGTYTVTLTASSSVLCVAPETVSQTITVVVPVTVEAGLSAVQVERCNGYKVETSNTSTGSNVGYSWDMGDGTVLTGGQIGTYAYATGGLHTILLTATDTLCGGVDTARVTVDVLGSPEFLERLDVPNVFSPNNDGKNDSFFPIEEAASQVTMKVWNRYGKLIYESAGAYKPWNGKQDGSLVPDGVYFYELKYSGACNGNVQQGLRKGSVQVLAGR
jgi:gliding motility-associated-like protein